MSVQLKSGNEIIGDVNQQVKNSCRRALLQKNTRKVQWGWSFSIKWTEITLPVSSRIWWMVEAKHIIQTLQLCWFQSSPVPDYTLTNIKKYNSLNLQYTRGCPDNWILRYQRSVWRKVRTKTTEQVPQWTWKPSTHGLAEKMYFCGW